MAEEKYKICCIDDGRVQYMTLKEAIKFYGKTIFNEMVQGELSNYKVTSVDSEGD